MSDDEIIAMQKVLADHPCAPPDCGACDMLALADEALARGKRLALLEGGRLGDDKTIREQQATDRALRERVAQLERELTHFKAPDALPDQTWQEVLDRALERVAQLETALTAGWRTAETIANVCDPDHGYERPQIGALAVTLRDRLRAALAAGKP